MLRRANGVACNKFVIKRDHMLFYVLAWAPRATAPNGALGHHVEGENQGSGLTLAPSGTYKPLNNFFPIAYTTNTLWPNGKAGR